jgi:hypothetical protein
MLFILTTATLATSDRVNETLGITFELNITSHAADFINQTLSFLAYGGKLYCENSESNLSPYAADG